MDTSAGGGEGGAPGSGMTREQVMAQRAEKKKLKEARKNKSGAGGGDGGGTAPSGGGGGPGKTEEKKKEEVAVVAGGGGGAPPGSELSRDEVMAQREEKKKLKEARKNKSAAGSEGGGTPGGGAGNLEASDQKKQAGQAKKPQQQQQQQPKSNKSSEQVKQQPQPAEAAKKSSKGPAGPNKPQQQQQQQKSPSPAPAAQEAKTPKKSDAVAAVVVPSTDGDTAKSETPDRSIVGGTKAKTEYQSTIQSLFQVKKGSSELARNKKFQLHPLFHSLGVKLRHNVIRETNARCVALLDALKEYVKCYQTPPGTSFKHELSNDLQQNMDALREKCPFAIGMNNAVEFLNAYLYKMDRDIVDINKQKEEIMEVIEEYIIEKIEKAVEAIVMYGAEKVRTGDVIMIYSITESVINMLEKASSCEDGKERKRFELIIIQTPDTLLDIPILLKKLSKPVEDQAIIISSVSFPNAIYRIRHCTKLVIGGHGLFTTGGVMAQTGSGQLALLAATYNKPTIFLCETYKFCDRSPLDFFTLDEYIPEQAITQEDLFQPKIKYDVTPANLVTVVITDIDLLPSTSVPVVLRLK